MLQSKNNDGSSSPCQFSSRTFIESLLKGFGSSSVTHRPIDIHILTHLHSPSMDNYVLEVHGPNKSSTFLCTSLPPIIPPSNIVAKRQEVKPFLKDSCCRDSLLLSNLLPFFILWTQRRSSIKPSPHSDQIVWFSPCHERGEKMFFLNFSHNRHAYNVSYTILQFVPYCTSLGYWT